MSQKIQKKRWIVKIPALRAPDLKQEQRDWRVLGRNGRTTAKGDQQQHQRQVSKDVRDQSEKDGRNKKGNRQKDVRTERTE